MRVESSSWDPHPYKWDPRDLPWLLPPREDTARRRHLWTRNQVLTSHRICRILMWNLQPPELGGISFWCFSPRSVVLCHCSPDRGRHLSHSPCPVSTHRFFRVLTQRPQGQGQLLTEGPRPLWGAGRGGFSMPPRGLPVGLAPAPADLLEPDWEAYIWYY